MEARHSTSKFPRISIEATVINQKISRKSIESGTKEKNTKDTYMGTGARWGRSRAAPRTRCSSWAINRTGRNPRWWERRGGDSEFRCFPSPPLHSPCLLSLSLSLCFFLRLSIFLKQWSRGGSGGKRRVEIGGKGSGFWKGREEKLPWLLPRTGDVMTQNIRVNGHVRAREAGRLSVQTSEARQGRRGGEDARGSLSLPQL